MGDKPPIILDYETPAPQRPKADPVLPLVFRVLLGTLAAYITVNATKSVTVAIGMRFFLEPTVAFAWPLFGDGLINAAIASFLWKALLWKQHKPMDDTPPILDYQTSKPAKQERPLAPRIRVIMLTAPVAVLFALGVARTFEIDYHGGMLDPAISRSSLELVCVVIGYFTLKQFVLQRNHER